MLPIDQLTKPVTKKQAKATLYTMLAKAGIDTTTWQPGAVVRTILWILSVLIAFFTQLAAVVVKGLFLDSATGVWLTLLAKYVYGVTRRGASFATGQLRFTNTKGGEYPFAVGECLVLNPATKKVYWNTEAFTITPLGTVDAAFGAKEAGAESTSSFNTITELVTPLIGVSVYNTGAFIGADEQLDDELRQDCRDALGALSPFGAAGAYKYFAKHLPGGDPIVRDNGEPIDVNRVQVLTNPGTGEVTVYLASLSGALSDDDVAVVHENLQANAVPQCITEATESAEAVPLTVLYDAYADVNGGKTASELKAILDAAIEAYGKTYPIAGTRLTEGGQGYLFQNRLRTITLDADSQVFHVIILQPLNDTPLDDGQFVQLVPAIGSTVTLVAQEA